MRPAVCFLALAASYAAGAEEVQVPAAVHVHSTVSTGAKGIEALAREAREKGLGAILLTENYAGRIDYGIWPLRRVAGTPAARLVLGRRKPWDIPSVLGGSPEAFLAEVDRARRAVPEVAIIPGIEVVPHYRWTGSLPGGDLTIHDFQRNLLVFGTDDAASLRRVPTAGTLGDMIVLDPVRIAAAVLGVVLAALAIRRIRRGRRARPAGNAFVWEGQRFLLPGARRRGVPVLAIGLLLLAAILLLEGIPPTAAPYSQYGPDPGDAPATWALLWARRHGLPCAWSLPDAKAVEEHAFRFGIKVKEETLPYPDLLLRMDRFDAFGGIVSDTSTFCDPGGPWDRLLRDAAGGKREPAWAFGEIAYHDDSAGKTLEQIQTVFVVPGRTEAAILDALHAGRFYARQCPPGAPRLRLDRFRIVAEGGGLVERPVGRQGIRKGAVRPGAASAGPGEWLLPAGAGHGLRVEAAVSAEGGAGTSGGEAPVEVILVRSGTAIRTWREKLPAEIGIEIPASEVAAWTPGFVRLEARAGGARLLSNPIFWRTP